MGNFNGFANGFVQALLSSGAIAAQEHRDTAITDSTKNLVFFKSDSSVLFIYSLYNCDLVTPEEIKAHAVRLQQNAQENISANRFRMIINTLIPISSTQRQDIEALVRDNGNYFGEVLELYYNVVLDQATVYANPKQPPDVVDLKPALDSGFSWDSSPSQPLPNMAASATYQERSLIPRSSPFFVYCIMFINVLVFTLCELNGGSENIENLIRFGAMNYELMLSGDFYRPLSSIFLHSGIMHLAFNSLALYIYGTRSEKYCGKPLFVLVYLASGLAASLLSGLIAPDGVMVGASGAIFGLGGALFVLTVVTGKTADGLRSGSLFLLLISSLAFGFLLPNVGNIAHITGLVTGAAVTLAAYILGQIKKE